MAHAHGIRIPVPEQPATSDEGLSDTTPRTANPRSDGSLDRPSEHRMPSLNRGGKYEC